MSKLLTFLMLAIFCATSCLQPVPEGLHQSQISSISQASASNPADQVYALQKANIHDAVDAQSRRIEDIQYQQMWYMAFLTIGVALLMAVITYALNNKLKSLRDDLEDQKDLIKGKIELLDDTVEIARQRVKLFQQDIDAVIKLAREKVREETETANTKISNHLEVKLKEAKKELNEIITHRDKVADLVREVHASDGSLSTELATRMELQVTETKKTKPEDEYTTFDWFLEGEKLKEDGQYADACERYTKSLVADPNNADAYNQWGYSLYKLGQIDESIKKYKKSIEVRPNSPRSYNNWADILIQQGKHKEAIEKLEKATILAPTYPNIYRHWGDALIGLNEFELSLAKFNEAIDLNPNYLEAYSSWNNALNSLLEVNATLYPYKVNEFKEVIDRHKGLEALRNHEEFKYIYKKYFS